MLPKTAWKTQLQLSLTTSPEKQQRLTAQIQQQPKNIPSDYLYIPSITSEGDSTASCSTTQGLRPHQEDVCKIYKMQNTTAIETVCDADWENIFGIVFDKLASELNDEATKVEEKIKTLQQNPDIHNKIAHWRESFQFGSTLAVALVINTKKEKKIIVATAGDSNVFAIETNQDIVAVTALGIEHKTTDSNEQQRVQNEGGKIMRDHRGAYRLNGILAIARGFSFLKNHSQYKGLTAEPDVFVYHLPTNTESNTAIAIECDGITDTMNALDQALVIKNKLHSDLNAEMLTKTLIKESLSNRSTDNCTVGALNLGTGTNDSFLMILADGFGLQSTKQFKSNFVPTFLVGEFPKHLTNALNIHLQTSLLPLSLFNNIPSIEYDFKKFLQQEYKQETTASYDSGYDSGAETEPLVDVDKSITSAPQAGTITSTKRPAAKDPDELRQQFFPFSICKKRKTRATQPAAVTDESSDGCSQTKIATNNP